MAKRLGNRTQISRREVIAAMRRLIINDDFLICERAIWSDEENKIIEDGKKSRSSESWAKLEGFHSAMLAPRRWAALEGGEVSPKRLANELQEQLTGDKKS